MTLLLSITYGFNLKCLLLSLILLLSFSAEAQTIEKVRGGHWLPLKCHLSYENHVIDHKDAIDLMKDNPSSEPYIKKMKRYETAGLVMLFPSLIGLLAGGLNRHFLACEIWGDCDGRETHLAYALLTFSGVLYTGTVMAAIASWSMFSKGINAFNASRMSSRVILNRDGVGLQLNF